MSDNHGQFIWYDLITPDPEAAVKFYSRVVGWGTQQWEGAEPYTMWTNDGVPLGGVVETGPSMSENKQWLAYVAVDDVDETASKAQSLGATIVGGPNDIPNSGRYAIIEDPQGATIAIYKSATPDLSYEFNPVSKKFSWHELATTDHKKAFDFYSALFGWNRNGEMDMGPQGIYQMYGKGEVMYGGMYDTGPGMPMPNSWCCYVMVDSVDEAVERVKEAGGEILNGPMDVPGGSVSQCMDPQRVLFALHSKKAQA